jgi:hypothetical protein
MARRVAHRLVLETEWVRVWDDKITRKALIIDLLESIGKLGPVVDFRVSHLASNACNIERMLLEIRLEYG